MGAVIFSIFSLSNFALIGNNSEVIRLAQHGCRNHCWSCAPAGARECLAGRTGGSAGAAPPANIRSRLLALQGHRIFRDKVFSP